MHFEEVSVDFMGLEVLFKEMKNFTGTKVVFKPVFMENEKKI